METRQGSIQTVLYVLPVCDLLLSKWLTVASSVTLFHLLCDQRHWRFGNLAIIARVQNEWYGLRKAKLV